MSAHDWLSQGTLVLASNNKGKIAEFEKMFAELNLPVEVIAQGKLDIEDAIEDGLSFVENAIIKARHAARISGKPAIADDSGICVPRLGGAPGIYSARYAGEHGDDAATNEKLLADLKPLRKNGEAIEAMFVCVLALVQHQDDPLPQYVQENDSILTGDTQAERLELDVLNVRRATPSVGNPKGVVFGDLQTTGFYQATDDKVVYQQSGVITANMPNLATIPTATSDKTLVTAEWVQQLIAEATRIKVGDLYFTTNNVNPNTGLGYGTWQKYAEGRAIVGHSGDVTSATPDWAKVGDNIFGSYTHILSVPEMPSHGHVVTTGGVSAGTRGETEGGNHTENNNGSGSRVGGTAQPTGGGLPHNNVQPSIVVFIWRRTA